MICSGEAARVGPAAMRWAHLVALAVSLAMASPSAGAADPLYLRLTAFLDAPFAGFASADLTREQGIIVLSFAAQGMGDHAAQEPAARSDIVQHLERIIEILLRPDVCPLARIDEQGAWDGHGLYLSHLNIVLGSYQRVAGDTRYVDLNRAISAHLASAILNAPLRNIHSYPHQPEIWPADNAAALASVGLFDRNNGTDLAARPIAEWLHTMSTAGRDASTGLHLSELAGLHAYSSYPRGCALSWTVKYMAEFAPPEARALWGSYKRHFEVSFLGLSGLREYPRSIDLGEDYDSGPIVFGMGAAATGLGLCAAAAVGDEAAYASLDRTVRAGGWLAGLTRDRSLKEAWDNLLATAIRYNAERKLMARHGERGAARPRRAPRPRSR